MLLSSILSLVLAIPYYGLRAMEHTATTVNSLKPVKAAVHHLLKDHFALHQNLRRNRQVATALDILHFSLDKSNVFQAQSGGELKQNLVELEKMLTGSTIFLRVFPLKGVSGLFSAISGRTDHFDGDVSAVAGAQLFDAFERINKSKYYNIQRALKNLAENKITFSVKKGETGYHYITSLIDLSQINEIDYSDEQGQSNLVRNTISNISRLAHPFWFIPSSTKQANSFFELVRCHCGQGHSEEATEKVIHGFLTHFSKTDLTFILNRLEAFIHSNPRVLQLLNRFLSVYGDNKQLGMDSFLMALKLIATVVRKTPKPNNNVNFLCDLFENALFPAEGSFGSFAKKVADRLFPNLFDRVGGETEEEVTINAGEVFIDLLTMSKKMVYKTASPFMSYCSKHDPEFCSYLLKESESSAVWMAEYDPTKKLDGLHNEIISFGPLLMGNMIRKINQHQHYLLEALIAFRLGHFGVTCMDVEWISLLAYDPTDVQSSSDVSGSYPSSTSYSDSVSGSD